MPYAFQTEPFQHQRTTFEDSWAAEYHALLMEMGTGKSKVVVDTMGALYEKGLIDAALIVAPKGVYDNWVQKEIPQHLPERINRKIVRWRPDKTKAFEETFRSLVMDDFDGLKVFVINVETFSTGRGAEAAYAFLEQNPDNLMAVDESTTIKNRNALRTKNVVAARQLAKYRRILTGSPITKSPMDLFSQCNFLSPKALGTTSYFAFQNRYAVIVRRSMGHRSFQEIVGYRRLDELSEKLDNFSTRVLKSECLDLPPKLYIRREVPLTPEQKRVYDQMRTLALAVLSDTSVATTQSVLTQIMRLQQICCGFFRPDEGGIQQLPNDRLSELMDVLDGVSGKAIIWATYTHSIKQITEEIAKVHGPRSVAAYYGETPQDERQEIVNRFQDPSDPLRFFVGQPRTGGYGITLTEANTVIYFSNSYDLEIRLQSEDRAHRIGQQKAVTYVDLVSPNTVDEKVLSALYDKNILAGQVLGEEVKGWLSGK
jgi:SNF2 family DNA or RNA helicase